MKRPPLIHTYMHVAPSYIVTYIITFKSFVVLYRFVWYSPEFHSGKLHKCKNISCILYAQVIKTMLVIACILCMYISGLFYAM
jgi:hypothetical protein